MVLNIKFDVEPEGFDSAVRAEKENAVFATLFPSEKPIISETRQARDKRNKEKTRNSQWQPPPRVFAGRDLKHLAGGQRRSSCLVGR